MSGNDSRVENDSGEIDLSDSDFYSYECPSFIGPIISTIITVALLAFEIYILLKGFSPLENLCKDCLHLKLNIAEKSFKIIDTKYIYVFWGFHCLGLVVLPILFVFTFKYQFKQIYSIPFPFMMLLNIIGGILPMKYSCYPLLIELLLTIFLLLKLPFKSIYIYGRKGFFLGELTLMLLTFIFISVSFGANTISYVIFGPYTKLTDYYYSNPYNAMQLAFFLHSEYLSIYSFFTFLNIGIGFYMSFRNSISMTIPYLLLVVFTILRTKRIGYIFLVICCIHIIYIICLYIRPTRKLLGGCCAFCSTSFIGTSRMIVLGDLTAFFFVVLPSLLISMGSIPLIIDPYNIRSFNTDFLFISMVFAIVIFFHSTFVLFLKAFNLVAATIGLIGINVVVVFFGGSEKFMQLMTYEITYLSWNFMLGLWSIPNGYSPVLLKFYSILIPIGSWLITSSFNSKLGILELISVCFQIVVDSVLFLFVLKLPTKYMAWTVASFGGIALFGAIAAAFLALAFLLIYFIAYCCCQFTESWSFQDVADLANDFNQSFKVGLYTSFHSLKNGDTFYCGGKYYTYYEEEVSA